MSGLSGRIYWSEGMWERDCKTARIARAFDGRGSMIGRLESGEEVEYNLLITDDSLPEPEGDFRFLGRGEYVGPCRTAVDNTPLEQIEMRLMGSPYIPTSMRFNSRAIEEMARAMRDGTWEAKP